MFSKITFFKYSIISLSAMAVMSVHANTYQCEFEDKKIVMQQPDVEDAINIYADNVELLKNNTASFDGNVSLIHNDTQLTANQATFSKQDKKVNALGNIVYTDGLTSVESEKFSADLDNNIAQLFKATYRLGNNMGRGEAEALTMNEAQSLNLLNATFTTCPEGDESWLLKAGEINISQEQGWGSATNSVLTIFDTPVVYIPYITFPIDDRRKSGFLYPKISSSVKLGLELETPYYWNIAPNLDATITPRYMSKRGLQLKTQFRYLTETHEGYFHLEYLNKDDDAPQLGARSLARWQQNSTFSDDWRMNIDITDVSDDNYFSDLNSTYGNTTDTQLDQQVALSYFGDTIDAKFRVQSFEVLGDHPTAYKTLPQVTLSNGSDISLGIFNINWLTEITNFQNKQAEITDAQRLHIEPNIAFSFHGPAGDFTGDLSLLHTHYSQKYANGDTLNLTRTLPKLQLNGKLNFERETHWFKREALQTFEPQIQYLYVPEKDQSDIGLFDTALLQNDYHGLFRDFRYSGLDRVTDANQFTLGATTRYFDKNNEELLSLSLGQIFYLKDQNNLNDSLEEEKTSRSLLAADAFIHWHKRWYAYGGVQYDTKTNDVIKSNITLDYRSSENKLVQLNHRYSRAVSDNEIQQLGIITSMPINESFQFVASHHRNLINKTSIESYLGIQYESCCWAIQVMAHRTLDTNLESQNINFIEPSNEFDNGISLRFVIKGLGDKRRVSTSKMLDQGLFGYRRPYFLNN